MLSGLIRQARDLVTATAVVIGVAVLSAGTAAADPSQDDKFLTLLGYQDIPPIDNVASLIDTAHKVCGKLDGGMSVGDLVDLIRNNGYNENPLTRLDPPRRVTATINRFINASVQAYCPYDQGKIVSITAQAVREPERGIATPAAWRQPAGKRDVVATVLALVIGPVPAGEIAPTNPPPIPVQVPPAPQEVAPAPRESPPPPQRVQPVPQQAPPRQQQAEPPPQEAPPPPQAEPPPQEVQPPPEAEPPAAAPPPGGGDAGGAPANPSPQPPAPPGPPGHVRLAP